MNRHPVHVVHPRRGLPLAAVVGEVDLGHKLTKGPDPVLFVLGIGLSYNPVHNRRWCPKSALLALLLQAKLARKPRVSLLQSPVIP